MKINQLLEQLIAKKNLTHEQMQTIFHDLISGKLNDIQIAAFLALMRAKGETTEELSAAALVMQQLAHKVDLGPRLVDIVGTGGDGKNTFNISTAASFVIASTGLPVAKHGGRASSSLSGSADVLEAAGFKLNLTDEKLQSCIKECNLAFLFAPIFHPAMQQAAKARSQLGIKTFFNLLGPLINPALVKRQVIGVFRADWLKPLAMVASTLGRERILVVHSEDGLDEISVASTTKVLEYNHGQLHEWQIRPEAHGLRHPSLDEIIVDSPQKSLALIEEVLDKKAGAARDIVILNAAAAIYCAENNITFEAAIESARHGIDSGRARKCFDKLLNLTQTLSADDE